MQWTITYTDAEGLSRSTLSDQDGLLDTVLVLHSQGVDLHSVRLFPPNSDLSFAEVFIKKQKEMKSMLKRYTLEELQGMPTLVQGHFDDLKYDDGTTRVWLSRMTIDDGAPYNNQVTVERKNEKGDWEIIEQYQAK